MRLFLPIFLLFVGNILFAQDSATIKEINALVGPKFHFDTTDNNYGDDFFAIDKRNNNIIVTTWDTGINNIQPLKKIFVLRMVGNKLIIIDTSSTLEFEGRGLEVWVKHDTLELYSSHHGGTNKSVYKFNKKKKKYLLIGLQNSEVLKTSIHGYNDVTIGVRKEYYNVNKQELIIEVWDDETKIISGKIIKKPLPKNFIPELAHYYYLDLVGDDLRYSNLH